MQAPVSGYRIARWWAVLPTALGPGPGPGLGGHASGAWDATFRNA